MQLEIVKTEAGKNITLALKGVINTASISAFSAILDTLDYDGLDLTLDFSDLTYMTSVGLRALLILRKRLDEDHIRILNMNDAIRYVFEMSGFMGFIPIVSSGAGPMPEDPSYRQLLSYHVRTHPDHQVVFYDGHAYTWRDLDKASQIVAKDLADAGFKRGTHIGLFARNTHNWFVAFFAAQKLGAIVALLNFSLKPEELVRYSHYGDITFLCFDRASARMDAQAFRAAVTGPDSRIAGVYEISPDLDFLSRREELKALGGVFTEEYDADNPCIMIFTSGSTGLPKGVLFSAHDRLTNSHLMNDELRPTAEDKICLFLPQCHVFGIDSGLNLVVTYDIPVYMPSASSDEALLATIQENGCTLFNSVPTKLLSMVRCEQFDPRKTATLRATVIAGAGMTEPQLLMLKEKIPQVHFIPLYGLTEFSPVSMTRYNDTLEHITRAVGHPVQGVSVEIRDRETGKAVPTGTEGEICVQSATSLICYYKAALDKQAVNSDGWIPTGDLGHLDEDGYLYLTGRCKDLIIWGGENISPKEIEEVLSQLDWIQDIKVVGVPDEKYGEIVAAAVVPAPGTAFSPEAANAHVTAHLARYKAPAYYVLYDAFPLLANGKIDMVTLKRQVAEKRAGSRNA